MSYTKEELARMNRSGQRGGAVGSKPTVVTRAVLNMVQPESDRMLTDVLDFGAGKKAAQTRILLDEGFWHVYPYDVGDNAHDGARPDTLRYDVVMMSNVLNVQPTLGHIHVVLDQARNFLRPSGMLICNLPREPRYGNYGEREVAAVIRMMGFDIIEEVKYGSGTMWKARK